MEENVQQPTPTTPAAPPAAPPADYVPASIFTDRVMDVVQHYLTQQERDAIAKAQIAGREAQRAEQEKAKAEREASAKRAEDAVKEVIDRDKPKEQPPTPGGPPVALELPPLLTQAQIPIAEEYTASMGEVAAEMGMPADEAQTLLDFVVGGATQTLEELNTGNREEVVNHLRNFYGDEQSKAIIEGAQAGFKKLPEGVQAWLDHEREDGSRLGNHPAVLSMLALWNAGYTKMGQQRAYEELKVARSSKEYFAGDRATLDKVRLLSLMMKGARDGSGNEMTFEKPAQTPVKSSVQQEIDKIRGSKEYTSIDAKVRAPLIARMSQLMAQLHGNV